jgi:hypothetical protein
MKAVDIKVSDVVKEMNLTVNISGVRIFKLRLSIGVWLIRIAAKLIGCGIEVKT